MFKGIPTAAAAAAFFQIIWSIRETPVGIVKTSDWQISQASFLRALKATSRREEQSPASAESRHSNELFLLIEINLVAADNFTLQTRFNGM
jgi:phosphatidylserine synthase